MEKFGEAINTPENVASTEILEPKKERVQGEGKFEEKVEENEKSEAPEGWMTVNSLCIAIHRSAPTIKEIISPYRQSNPEWFKKNKVGHEYLSPELTSIIEIELPVEKTAPENWKTLNLLHEATDISERAIKEIISPYRQSNPEWFGKFIKNNQEYEFFSPEILSIVKDSIIPEDWKTITSFRESFNRSERTIKNVILPYRQSNPEWFKKKIGGHEYVSPELSSIIEGELQNKNPKEGWQTRRSLYLSVGSSAPVIENIVLPYRKSNPEWFENRRGNKGVREYFSPELSKIIIEKFENEKNKKQYAEEFLEREQFLKTECDNFFREVSEEDTVVSQEFKKLLGSFGSSQIFDILYKYHPEFEGVSTEYIKGSIAKYLGDFLVIRNNFRIKDFDVTLPYLSDKSFQDALFEVVKENCLSNYHEEKMKDKTRDDQTILTEYIESIKEETSRFNNDDLNQVIDRTEAYYSSLLNDFKKPDNIIDEVREGRQFPDLNQTLNIKEITEKKRMLIGDEMGMGKSASAILAKEYIGSKLALVVVPSNVIDTWQGYLSDEVSEEGKQVGYFKEGEAPHVFVVEDIKSLDDFDSSAYDYVLISQERMNQRYLTKLKTIGYDMLIIDEVHKLKNLQTGQRSQHILELSENVNDPDKHLVLLSGTPVPNKIKDVAMILKLLYPEKFKEIRDDELVASIIGGELVDIRNLLIPHMQMKTLRESIEMPELTEEVIRTPLSDIEQDIYEVLLEDDELTADEKIRAFRKFVMNPTSLETTPDIQGSKIDDIKGYLQETFQTKDKVVMFVNGYVEGMIRGENTIIDELNLPDDILVRVIDGSVDKDARVEIQKELRESKQKMFLAVSGQTADVGVDFSSADHVLFYNDPWTKYDKQQQTARVYRPGLEKDLTVATSIVEGTIEEGIHEYIELKYNAIQKLLKGVPITDIEKDILKKAERQQVSDVEGDAEIAKEWLSSPQNRLHRFFGVTKEIGEKNFHKFLLEYGEEYAECYLEMGSRGFQANTGRIVGSLIDSFVQEKGQEVADLQILDIASGPEMLKKHSPDKYKDRIISLDINEAHFANEGEGRVIASFTEMPFKKDTIDYANLSLALHYTRLIPSREEFERLRVISEMNRVLKVGGRGVINLLYSLQFKDQAKLKKVMEMSGFKVMEEYTGDITSGGYYRSPCVVVEKEKEVEADFDEFVKQIGKEDFDGIKFRDSGLQTLKNSRRVVDRFSLNGKEMPVSFNDDDQEIYESEQSILREGEELKNRFGSIKDIPKEDIIKQGFLKIFNGRNYRLLKKSGKIGGFADIR